MKKFILLCLLMLLGVPCLAEMVSVVHLPAELRDRPLVAGSQVISQLSRYTPLELIGAEGEYLKVKDLNGTVGYLHKSLADKTKSVAIIVDLCNIRSGPGTSHPPLFRAARGASFKVLGEEDDWLNVLAPDDRAGWVAKKLTWGY